MIHRPFLRSAIQVVGDFRIGDFDLHSFKFLYMYQLYIKYPIVSKRAFHTSAISLKMVC